MTTTPNTKEYTAAWVANMIDVLEDALTSTGFNPDCSVLTRLVEAKALLREGLRLGTFKE